MLIHRSFGFPNIFLKGGLETPKTPLDPPLDNYQEVVITQWYCSYNIVLSFDVWLHCDRMSSYNLHCVYIQNSNSLKSILVQLNCMHTKQKQIVLTALLVICTE